jgi:YD repeat-containing protein
MGISPRRKMGISPNIAGTSNLDSAHRPHGRVMEFNYDNVHRRTAERWMDGSTTVRTLSFEFDALGRVTSASDPASRWKGVRSQEHIAAAAPRLRKRDPSIPRGPDATPGSGRRGTGALIDAGGGVVVRSGHAAFRTSRAGRDAVSRLESRRGPNEIVLQGKGL